LWVHWSPGLYSSPFVVLACSWGFGRGWVSFFSDSWWWFRNTSQCQERHNHWGSHHDWENMVLDCIAW
jgi:hypothetical protein